MAASKKRGSSHAGPRLQETVRLSADGPAKVLGDLEARVLRAVWAIPRAATAREIHDRVLREHEVSPLTTITVLNRLVAKRVLTRTKREGRIHFAARLNEEQFLLEASRRVVEGILSLGTDAVTASLVDVLAEQDPDQLQELARLIRRKLRERDGS